jgi:hypothetical protein
MSREKVVLQRYIYYILSNNAAIQLGLHVVFSGIAWQYHVSA